MSKKSRRRNKRLLALAGLAGAVALSKRKAKADLAGTEDGKGGMDTIDKAKQAMTSDAAYSTKKDTVVKTPTTIQDNKPAKRSNASIAGDFISKVTNPKKMEYGMQMSNDLVNSKLPPRIRTPIKADNSGIIKQYKSGGRVKGCGIAKRGLGRAMKKGKR